VKPGFPGFTKFFRYFSYFSDASAADRAFRLAFTALTRYLITSQSAPTPDQYFFAFFLAASDFFFLFTLGFS
jgi:hypothetical protein